MPYWPVTQAHTGMSPSVSLTTALTMAAAADAGA